MDTISIVCEQAIFTSARGPAGEGYRIVAASKGLRAEEKQKITQCSPSHESLCIPADADSTPPPKPSPLPRGTTGGYEQRGSTQKNLENKPATGAAFYSLPGGRHCIALSHHAGAEHTGRGGQRVYTHNLIVSGDDLAKCGFNPFTIIRALPPSATDSIKLPQTGTLPALVLQVDAASTARLSTPGAALLPPPARSLALQNLLQMKPLVLDVAKNWLTWAEALLLAVPAPLRFQLSFAAGLRFSLGRGHTLHVFRDEKNLTQGKVAAQGIQYVGVKSTPTILGSNWHSFVERHWAAADLSGLARRTSRKFEDCSPAARERVGELYNSMDDVPQTESTLLLDLVFRSLNASRAGVEGEVHREFRETVQQQLRSRFAGVAWPLLQSFWNRLVEFWRNGQDAAVFAQPLLNLALTAAMRSDPLMAADLALTIAQAPPAADRHAHESMIQQVVGRLATMNPNGSPDAAAKLANIATRWRAVRPNCSLVAQLSDRFAIPHGVR